VIRWLVVSWTVNAIVLALTAWVLNGVSVEGSNWTVVWAAAVFAILNTILKPILRLITLPFAIVTFGLVWFFVSMFMLWLTSLIVSGFDVDGFWTYVWATIVIWALNVVIDLVLGRRGGAAYVASGSVALIR
jgi:putative membrane protein